MANVRTRGILLRFWLWKSRIIRILELSILESIVLVISCEYQVVRSMIRVR